MHHKKIAMIQQVNGLKLLNLTRVHLFPKARGRPLWFPCSDILSIFHGFNNFFVMFMLLFWSFGSGW